MIVSNLDALDTLTDDQLWEVAAEARNSAEIRQQAIRQWLFPEETNSETSADDAGGGRFYKLRRRATRLDSDEIDEGRLEDLEQASPYFDTEGRLILEHDGVFYSIDSLEDEGAYDGISNRHDVYSTDEKTNVDRDL
jgi:hypothetical protein